MSINIMGVIPARYESTRFPSKPLAMILGKPMIYWVYRQAMKVKEIDYIIVATDDQRIKDTCKNYKIPCMMTKNSHKTGTDRVAEVAHQIKANYYVIIQGDEPVIHPESIHKCIHLEQKVTNLMKKIENQSEIYDKTVPKIRLKGDSYLNTMSRIPIKTSTEEPYYKQIGIYGYQRDTLLRFGQLKQGDTEKLESIEILRCIENDIPVKMIPVKHDTVAVDIPSDIQQAESAIKKRIQAIIFDFDGTIVDSENIKQEAFKNLFRPFDLQDKVDVTKGGKDRYDKIRYYYKKLLNHNLSWNQLECIANNYHDMTFEKIVNAPYIEGAMEFIKACDLHITMFVVSGTPTDELINIMIKRKITKYFQEIIGSDDYKLTLIKGLLAKYHYDPDRVIYIGDKLEDYGDAKKAGIKFFGITHGKTNFPKNVPSDKRFSSKIWEVID